MPGNWNLLIRTSIWMVRPEKDLAVPTESSVKQNPTLNCILPNASITAFPRETWTHQGRNLCNYTNVEQHMQPLPRDDPADWAVLWSVFLCHPPVLREHQWGTRTFSRWGVTPHTITMSSYKHHLALWGAGPGNHLSTHLILNTCAASVDFDRNI